MEHHAEPPFPLVDHGLARRLERAEARANAASVEARARLSPDVGATWIEVAGAYAMFDGPQSPLTQTFGLGLFDAVGPGDLERLEAFFSERGAATFHEVSPLAQAGLLHLLHERGYRPLEFTSVMFRPIGQALGVTPAAQPAAPRDTTSVRARPIRDDECDAWARTAAEGWSEFLAVDAFMGDIGRLSTATAGATCFVAESDAVPIATGVLCVHEGIALLAGASTIPCQRRRGAQRALLEARLRLAVERGCDLAMMCAVPGSPSQRNAERQGFRIAYTRLKWQRP